MARNCTTLRTARRNSFEPPTAERTAHLELSFQIVERSGQGRGEISCEAQGASQEQKVSNQEEAEGQRICASPKASQKAQGNHAQISKEEEGKEEEGTARQQNRHTNSEADPTMAP